MTFSNRLISKTSSVKYLCYLFVASHVVLFLMMTYTFPIINSQIGTKAFDLQTLGYSVSEASSIVNNMNEETRNLYLFPQLALLDLLYPFLLALFLSSLLFRLISPKNHLTSILLIVPFLAMLFDYLENICIVLMITKTMETSTTMVFLSSSFTLLKGLLTSIAWLGILVYTIKWLRNKRLQKNKLS